MYACDKSVSYSAHLRVYEYTIFKAHFISNLNFRLRDLRCVRDGVGAVVGEPGQDVPEQLVAPGGPGRGLGPDDQVGLLNFIVSGGDGFIVHNQEEVSEVFLHVLSFVALQ